MAGAEELQVCAAPKQRVGRGKGDAGRVQVHLVAGWECAYVMANVMEGGVSLRRGVALNMSAPRSRKDDGKARRGR
jgi:hypothetical protein